MGLEAVQEDQEAAPESSPASESSPAEFSPRQSRGGWTGEAGQSPASSLQPLPRAVFTAEEQSDAAGLPRAEWLAVLFGVCVFDLFFVACLIFFHFPRAPLKFR